MKTFFGENNFGKFLFFECYEGDMVIQSDKFHVSKRIGKKKLSKVIADSMTLFNKTLNKKNK